MSTSFDFILLSVSKENRTLSFAGENIIATPPPRRTARGRSAEQLIAHVTFEGTAKVAQEAPGKLLQLLARTYYKTSGSVTSALRTAADTLNQELLSWNRRHATEGKQVIAMLSVAVVKGKQLYLMHCGRVHSFVIKGDDIVYFHEEESMARGLGLGRATPLRFYSTQLGFSDLLIFTPDVPSHWTSELLYGARKQPWKEMLASLIPLSKDDFKALIVQVKPGEGQMKILSEEALRAVQPGEQKQDEVLPVETSPGTKPETAVAQPSLGKAAATRKQGEAPAIAIAPAKKPKKSQLPTSAGEDQTALAKEKAWMVVLRKFWKHLSSAGQGVARAFGSVLTRILPDESVLSLPSTTMLFVAIAVPVVVVAIAGAVYVQRGRGVLYEQYFYQAQSVALQANQTTSSPEAQQLWLSVLEYVDQAEQYRQTEDSKALRQYAESMLDQLETVIRVSFQPIVVNLIPRDSQIRTLLVDTNNDMYLLDEENNVIYRLVEGDRGYALDSDFICGGLGSLGDEAKLVGMTLVPRNVGIPARVLALDEEGMLIACDVDKTPTIQRIGVPRTKSMTPDLMSMDGDALYVLDKQAGEVWVYWTYAEITEPPNMYFDADQSRPKMDDVIEMLAYQKELYLLHQNGQVTWCNYQATDELSTRCDSPANYIDSRSGQELLSVLFEGRKYRDMQFVLPPDPSLFFLDAENTTIYHFTMRLRFLERYKPAEPLDVPETDLTGFAVDNNHNAYLAFGDVIYRAVLP